jgi:hypothetical protein
MFLCKTTFHHRVGQDGICWCHTGCQDHRLDLFEEKEKLVRQIDKGGKLCGEKLILRLTKSKSGIKPQIKRADVSHIKTINGTIIIKSERLSLTMYDLRETGGC